MVTNSQAPRSVKNGKKGSKGPSPAPARPHIFAGDLFTDGRAALENLHAATRAVTMTECLRQILLQLESEMASKGIEVFTYADIKIVRAPETSLATEIRATGMRATEAQTLGTLEGEDDKPLGEGEARTIVTADLRQDGKRALAKVVKAVRASRASDCIRQVLIHLERESRLKSLKALHYADIQIAVGGNS